MAERQLSPEPGRFNWEEGDTIEFVNDDEAKPPPRYTKTTKTTSETTETFHGKDYNECHDPHSGEFCGEGGGGVEGFSPGEKARGTAADIKATKDKWLDDSPHRTLDGAMGAAKESQKRLGDVGRKIARDLGVKFNDPGPKTNIERINQKAAERGGIHRVSDLYRGGFEVDTPEQADEIAKAIGKHFEHVHEDWKRTKVNYADKALQLRDKNGQVGELQIIEKRMARAKKIGHKYYEEQRTLDPVKDKARYEELGEKQRILYGGVLKRYSSGRERHGRGWKKALKL